jgi:hypothetical protein
VVPEASWTVVWTRNREWGLKIQPGLSSLESFFLFLSCLRLSLQRVGTAAKALLQRTVSGGGQYFPKLQNKVAAIVPAAAVAMAVAQDFNYCQEAKLAGEESQRGGRETAGACRFVNS